VLSQTDGPTDLDAATFLIAILALVISLVALYYARRATVANEKAATATQLQAEVAERAEERSREDAEANAVRWRIDPEGTASVRLFNDGTSTARDVTVSVLPDSRRVAGRSLPSGDVVGPAASLRIWVSQHAGAEPGELAVSYRLDPHGPYRSWSHRLD
jgi:hypothetical protein